MTVRRTLAAAALVLAAPALTACGSGFDAQTDQIYNPAVGVNDQSGEVDLTNVAVVSAADGSGTVIANLVNKDQDNADALKSVAGAEGNATGLTITPGGKTALPPGGMLNLAADGRIFVSGQQIQAGYYVTLTFTFERAAPATIQVPVVSTSQGDYTLVPMPPAS